MSCRQVIAIARATVLEILSEPLLLLLLLAALSIAVFAPAFHYHQFGETARMARDAGFSALFTCGSLVAVFCTIRSFRREVESGTLDMALAHPVSRGGFFVAKAIGAAIADLVFSSVVIFTMLIMVEGALVGGFIASRTGDIARIYGPFLAAGVAIAVLPLIVAAALNRFAHFRFCLSCVVAALVVSALGAAAVTVFNYGMVIVYLVAILPLLIWESLLLAVAAFLSAHFAANVAASIVGVVVLAMVPFMGNFYLADALARDGVVSIWYVLVVVASVIPLILALTLISGRMSLCSRQ